tara:strand:+ start:9302 stop:10564 length:1263 start_codon:yes stop_codon:yes gene_type:complete
MRNNSTYKVIITLLTLCLNFGNSQKSYSQEIDVKSSILKAIDESAIYLSTTILDEEGKSRCDYNLTEGKWYPYEVPWHTGQAIYALLHAYKTTENPDYLDRAVTAGNYWSSLQIKDEGKLKGMVKGLHGDFIGNQSIIFATISDGTPGLFELSRVTNNPDYAEVATSAASWMLANMYNEKEGVCYDVVNSKGEVQKENSPFWEAKNKEEQDLYDVSRPNTEGWLFLDAYNFSKEEKFKDAYINLCNSLLEKQGPEGLWMHFMPNFMDVGSFHPRFNLWYAESLIKAFELTGDRKYLEGAAKTARTYANAQTADGTIYYKNYIDGKEPDKGSICGSSVAFSGIVWMELVKNGYTEFEPKIELSLNWLLKNRFSISHPDPNLRGAVVNTRVRRKKGKNWIVNRDIGTSFGLRFFSDYLNYKY